MNPDDITFAKVMSAYELTGARPTAVVWSSNHRACPLGVLTLAASEEYKERFMILGVEDVATTLNISEAEAWSFSAGFYPGLRNHYPALDTQRCDDDPWYQCGLNIRRLMVATGITTEAALDDRNWLG